MRDKPKFIRRLMKWSGTEFMEDAEWAERKILGLLKDADTIEAVVKERDEAKAREGLREFERDQIKQRYDALSASYAKSVERGLALEEERDDAIARAEKWEVMAGEETRRLGSALVERDEVSARADKWLDAFRNAKKESESLQRELLEWRDRAEDAERRLSESLACGDRQEALIVELRDGLTRLSDKIREVKQ